MARRMDIRKLTYKDFARKFTISSAYWGVSKTKTFRVTDKHIGHVYVSGGVRSRGRGTYVVTINHNEFGRKGTVVVDMGGGYRLTPNTIGRVVYYALLRLA